MAFLPGQLVKPNRALPRRDGTLQDWRGKRSAQGWVESVDGVGPNQSAPFFNRLTSADDTALLNEQLYTVKVWDIDAQAFFTGTYPESDLSAGGWLSPGPPPVFLPITDIWPDPDSAMVSDASLRARNHVRQRP